MSPPAPPTTLAGGQQKKSTQNTKLLDAAAVYKKSVMNEGYGSANATAVHAKRPSTATQEDPFLGEELRIHARHIRDTLSPMLSFERVLSHTDLVLLRSIFRLLKSTTITIDLLRFSRMEKALQLIVVQSSDWPVETIVQAENTLLKWEDQLGQGSFKNLRADLWSEGGRLEGVRRIKDWRHRDDDANSSWEVDGAEPSRAYQCGTLGFEVGHWWLVEAAAFRDGIIDESSHAITADQNGAYAIVLSGNCEQNLRPDDQFEYHARKGEPNGFALSKTMTKCDPGDKVVRVLRSWRLRSRLAPKGGVRYDGLYRIIGYGFKPRTWQIHATLSRIPDQKPIPQSLYSDMLDDWRDYQHFRNIDRGEDFAILRDILRDDLHAQDEKHGKTARHESYDSGYFSHRASLLSGHTEMETPDSSKEEKFVLVTQGTHVEEEHSVESGTRALGLASDGAGDVMGLRGGGACCSRIARKARKPSAIELQPGTPAVGDTEDRRAAGGVAISAGAKGRSRNVVESEGCEESSELDQLGNKELEQQGKKRDSEESGELGRLGMWRKSEGSEASEQGREKEASAGSEEKRMYGMSKRMYDLMYASDDERARAQYLENLNRDREKEELVR